jgi:CRP-like cAMP-binding protein
MTDSTAAPPPPDTAPLLERVLAFSPIRSYAAGEPVLTPGTTTNAFYYLVSGSVAETPTPTTPASPWP